MANIDQHRPTSSNICVMFHRENHGHVTNTGWALGRLGIGGDLSDQGLVDGEAKGRHFCGEFLLHCVRDVVLGELPQRGNPCRSLRSVGAHETRS